MNCKLTLALLNARISESCSSSSVPLKLGRGAGAVVLTTAPEGVTPFVHGVTSSVQGVTIEQQRVK